MDFISRDLLKTVYQDDLFHNVYPELQFMAPFNNLYKEYGDEELSSKLCWYVCMYADPKSALYLLPPDVRKKELDENFLEEDSDEYPELLTAIEQYPDICMSPIQRSFKIWKDKLDERDELVKSNPYTMDNVEVMDKLVTSADKVYAIFKKAEQAYLKEISDTSVWGGGEESLSEKGEI